MPTFDFDKMNKRILIVAMLVATILLCCASLFAQETVYLVSINKLDTFILDYVPTPESAQDVIKKNTKAECNIPSILAKNTYFDLKTSQYWIYVEEKMLIVKPNGKRTYKRIKKKHRVIEVRTARFEQ